MDVELLEIRDFLAQHAPFETLPHDVLDTIPRQCTLRYARRGTVVLDAGDQAPGLFVVRSGAVDVVDEAGGLIERVGAGAGFGMSWLLERRPTRYRCTAREDTLLLTLPTAVFDGLAQQHPSFAAFYAGTHHDRLSRAIANLQQAASGSTVLSTRVRELISGEPVTIPPDATVAETAATMSRAGVSSILVTDSDGVSGIVTDRDLRNRVLAAELDPKRPVREVMTSPTYTVREDVLAFEAMLEMVSRGIHHLPLVDDHGAASGVLTITDLVRLENSNPVYLAADIGRQVTVAGVVELARRIPSVLPPLVDRDASAADISKILTALGDAVRRRVVALAEAELGSPPAAYSWVVLGSVAREEEALSADQDHALVLAEPGHDEWFASLATRVTDVLEECGWPRCPGNVMATNPEWRLTLDEWRERFATWSREPKAEAVLDAAIAYDLRHLWGDAKLAESARRAASSSASERLVGYLSAQAIRTQPPLGFFRGFVLEHEGQHGDKLDIKRGIAAVVQLARVYALRAGSTALASRERMTAAQQAGILDDDTAADLCGALELMSYWRLHHQVRQVRDGERPDNFVAPAFLTEYQRRHLKDAFSVVRSVQQQLAHRLGPVYS